MQHYNLSCFSLGWSSDKLINKSSFEQSQRQNIDRYFIVSKYITVYNEFWHIIVAVNNNVSYNRQGHCHCQTCFICCLQDVYYKSTGRYTILLFPKPMQASSSALILSSVNLLFSSRED